MPELVKIDDYGKIFIPKRLREALDASVFEVRFNMGELHLKPIKHPLALFGTLKKLRTSKLKEVHCEGEHELNA